MLAVATVGDTMINFLVSGSEYRSMSATMIAMMDFMVAQMDEIEYCPALMVYEVYAPAPLNSKTVSVGML
jgi:hypothetical protein